MQPSVVTHLHFILIKLSYFSLLIFGGCVDVCEYTEQSTSILHVDAQIAGWVQVRLPQWHWAQEWEGEGISLSSSGAKSRDESIITTMASASRSFSFVCQSEPFCDTRLQVNLSQLNLHLSNDVSAPERG